MKNFFRISCFGLSATALFFAVIPLVCYGVYHTGVWALLLFGILLLGVTLLWDCFCYAPGQIKRRLREVSDRRIPAPQAWWRLLRSVIVIGLAVFFVIGCVLSGLMARAAWFTPPQGESTVLVLGCQVMGDQPSKMLKGRLDVAFTYLLQHPDAVVICSGGLGENTSYSEAAVMQRYLVAQGIAPDRIYLEDQSHNTGQNLLFSSRIITEKGLSTSIVIATDGFHQLRASIYADKNRLSASSLPAFSAWSFVPTYWVREWFALVKAVL